MSDTTRTPRTQLPEFMRSPMMGQLVAAHLSELADTNTAVWSQDATARQSAEVALLRQAAREITDYHEARA